MNNSGNGRHNVKKELINLCMNRDRRFLKLDDRVREKLIDDVLAFGREAAENVKKEHGTGDPRKIVHNMGVVVRGVEGGVKDDLIIKSEYRSKDKEILIYRDALKIMMRKSIEESDAVANPLQLLIAHELFHYLEDARFGYLPEKFSITKWKIGPVEYKSKIRSLSEVGAHAFAQALLDISYSPLDF